MCNSESNPIFQPLQQPQSQDSQCQQPTLLSLTLQPTLPPVQPLATLNNQCLLLTPLPTGNLSHTLYR